MDNHKLFEYLSSYLTANRLNLINKVVQERTKHITVVIEDVYQERNAGALVRTCDCFGIQNIHIIEKEHSFKASHAISQGANKWVDLHIYKSIETCIHKLKVDGYTILATTPHQQSIQLEEIDIDKKTAILFGSELNGLSEKALALADGYLSIPIHGFSESYNISVSVGIILYNLSNKLKASNVNWQLKEHEILEKKIDWAKKTIPRGDKIAEHYLAKK